MSNRIVNFKGVEYNYAQLEIIHGLKKGTLKSARKAQNGTGIHIKYTDDPYECTGFINEMQIIDKVKESRK